MTRIYVHVDPELIARGDDRPLRVWQEGAKHVLHASMIEIEGPSRVVYDPAGLIDPEGREVRVWIETGLPVIVAARPIEAHPVLPPA